MLETVGKLTDYRKAQEPATGKTMHNFVLDSLETKYKKQGTSGSVFKKELGFFKDLMETTFYNLMVDGVFFVSFFLFCLFLFCCVLAHLHLRLGMSHCDHLPSVIHPSPVCPTFSRLSFTYGQFFSHFMWSLSKFEHFKWSQSVY